MQSSSSKTSNFLKAINKYAAEQRKEIKLRTEEFRNRELHKAEAEVLRDAYHLIQKEMVQMKKKFLSDVSNLEFQKRKDLFARRNSIMSEVFEKAKDKLLAFVKTPDYTELMKNYAASISQTLKNPGTVLYICKRDENLIDIIKNSFNNNLSCEVKIDNQIVIGGIRAVNTSMSMIIDETLDSKLIDQKEWFAANSKLNII